MGHPCLAVVVVHVPICTTLYIDARSTGKTRTVTRAEMVAIYTALDKFDTHEWVGIFTPSLAYNPSGTTT
jgi:hypothetical protein